MSGIGPAIYPVFKQKIDLPHWLGFPVPGLRMADSNSIGLLLKQAMRTSLS